MCLHVCVCQCLPCDAGLQPEAVDGLQEGHKQMLRGRELCYHCCAAGCVVLHDFGVQAAGGAPGSWPACMPGGGCLPLAGCWGQHSRGPQAPAGMQLAHTAGLTLQAAISSGQGESGLPACQVEAASPWLVVGVRPGACWHAHAAHCLAGPAGRDQQQENCLGCPSVRQLVLVLQEGISSNPDRNAPSCYAVGA